MIFRVENELLNKSTIEYSIRYKITLTKDETRVFNMLWQNRENLVPIKALTSVIWGYKKEKIIKDIISELKRKIDPTSLKIEGRYDRGYRLTKKEKKEYEK